MSPENDDPMTVEDDNKEPHQDICDQDDLTHVQTPFLELHIVKNKVWQGLGIRHSLMGQHQAEGAGQETSEEEEETQDSLQWLLRKNDFMFTLWTKVNIDMVTS